MNKKLLIIWGATGQCIMLEEALRDKYELIGLFDNNKDVQSPFENIQVRNGWNDFLDWKSNQKIAYTNFVVAIAGANGYARYQMHNKLKNQNLKPINSIHTSAYVSKDSKYGLGLQVMPNATICARVKIGESTIINTSASLDHECVLGNGVHIGPGAKLAGLVTVDDFSFIGTNATILPRIKIGKNSIIGAGSVVTKDIPDNSIAYGTPCKVVKQNKLI